MRTDYIDIRSRIQEEPGWFDEAAVPRYCPFTPDAMSNIYAREAVLVLAACQSCGHHFRLAMSRPSGSPSLATDIRKRTLYYGDPPNIGCCAAGPVMSVVELKVLKYWRRELGQEWARDSSLEVGVVANHLADQPRYADYADWDGNPSDPITEEPGGEQFQELVKELQARYPGANRVALEVALRSTRKIGISAMRCIEAAEAELPSGYQWPAHRLGDDGS
jgi:hypothetical protein